MKLRFAIGSVVAVCLSASAPDATAASPAQAPQPSLRELVRAWTRVTPQLPMRPAVARPASARADALGALLGGRKAEGRCAAPLLIALYQNGRRLNQPTRQLLDELTRPTAAGPGGVRMSAGGEFRIHFATDPASPDRLDPYDGDLNGVPDGVDRLAAELSDVLAGFVHAVDWGPAPAPSAPRGGVVDVYLSGALGASDSPAGFVMPLGPGWDRTGSRLDAAVELPEAADAAIFLDARLASADAASRDMVAHMVAHMILMRESVRESPWWHETSATWLENRLEDNAARVAVSFAGQTARARGLSDDAPFMTLEEFLWPHYLVQGSGSDPALLRRIWEEMAAVPGNNTFDAFDRVLRRVVGTSLAEEIRVFNIWNLFLGQADDGQHYPFASSLPTPQGDATYEIFPARGASLAGPLPALGAAMLRLLGDGSPGGLRIRFFGGEPGDWNVSLLVHAAGGSAGANLVPVEIDGSGRGFIPVPWKNLGAIDLVIQNLASPTAPPADYYFAIDYDATVPFDLLGFTAEDDASAATLSWTTESEERLAGWNIWRGSGPLGPFSRINRYLVPGAGLESQPMSYVYVDHMVEPGRKYYYYLEGVTLDGFTENSHAAGVRLGGPSAWKPSLR